MLRTLDAASTGSGARRDRLVSCQRGRGGRRAVRRRYARAGARARAFPAPAEGPARRQAARRRWRISSRPRTAACATTSAPSRSARGIGIEPPLRRFEAAHDDYSSHHAQGAGRPSRRGVRRAPARARAARVLGLCAGREARQRAADPRGIPRHPSGARLSGLSRSHREGHAVAAARRRSAAPASRSPIRTRCIRQRPSAAGTSRIPIRATWPSAASIATRSGLCAPQGHEPSRRSSAGWRQISATSPRS